MAEAQATLNGAIATESTTHATAHIPIGQLTPLLAAPASRAIKAVVTLTWPFSSVSGSVAFLLAEPDFRLRRIRGQVRVQFAGSSAKAVAKAGIASGDEVLLCLDGVEFVQNEGTIVSTPGRGVEFELKFAERLVVEFRSEGFKELKKIDIDHPEVEPETIPARLPTPERSLSPLLPAQSPQIEKGFQILEGGEWSSPAFIKRARTSYGSLFESDYDPFSEADGSARGRGRKRTRLSSSWRYHSQSPTLGLEDEVLEQVQVQDSTPVKPAPIMMDEACQTAELEENSAAEALADFAQQATNVGGTTYGTISEAPLQETQDSYEVETIVQQTIVSSEIQLQVQIAEVMDTPQSPRLQPIPSNSLPIVSPLMPFKAGLPATVDSQAAIASDQSISDQLLNLENGVEGELEDLYNASPIRKREETFMDELVENPTLAMEGVECPLPTEIYHPEDQRYGRWQSVNIQANEPRSRQASEERATEDLYKEPPQDGQFQEEVDYPVETQYPDLEDGIQDNAPIGWNYRPAEVGYPDIPDVYQPRGNSTSTEQPPTLSAAMSRSQSAMSEYVDLSEDDDDDEPPQPAVVSPFDDGMEEYDEEFEEEEEENLRASRNETGGRRYAVLDDNRIDEEGSSLDNYDQEESSEDENEAGRKSTGRMRDANNSRRMLHDGGRDEEGSDLDVYDEEEPSEDEDGAGEESRVRRQVNKGPSEVIEILSSDVEDESAPPRHASQEPRYDRTLPHPQQGFYEDEESGELAGSDGDGQILTRSDSDERDSLLEYDRSEGSQAGRVRERSQDVSESEESEAEEYVSSAPLLRGLNPKGGNIHKRGRLMIQEDEFMEENSEVDIQDEDDIESQPELSRRSQSASELQSQKGAPRRPFLQHRQSMDGVNDEVNELEADYSDLSGDEISQLEVQSPETVKETVEIETMKKGNVQLPTPLDTQLTEKVTPAEQSFTSVASNLAVEPEQSLNDRGTQFIIEASEEALDVDMIGVQEYVGIESPEAELAIEDKIVQSESPAPSFSDARPAESIEDMEKTMEITVVELDNRQRQSSNIPDSPFFETIEEAVATIDKDVVPGASEELETSSPIPAVIDAIIEPETLEKEFETIIEEAVKEASEELETNHTPSPIMEPMFEPFDEEPVKEASEELQSTSLHAARLDDPLPETLEEEFKHVIEDAVKGASEEVQSIYSVSVAPETLEQQMQRIIEEAEKEATEELRSSASPAAISETLEEEFDHIVEDAKKNVTAEEAQEGAHFLRVALKKINEKNISVEPIVNSSPASKVSTEVEPSSETSRRSTTRPKGIPNSLNHKENIGPVTPIKSSSRQGEDQTSPMVVLDSRETLKGHDASLELALAATVSPVKYDLRNPPASEVKLRLSRALRTELSEFTPLKVLRYHMNQKLDVLGIATTNPPEPQRAKGGPRHYSVVFNITDPSIAPSGVVEIQVFRPYKDALPTIEIGDGVLIRNFQVVSVKRGFALRSMQDEGSSWAVFKNGEEPEMHGPLVEYGAGEKSHIAGLKEWYESLDSTSMAKINRANGDKGTPGSISKGIGKA